MRSIRTPLTLLVFSSVILTACTLRVATDVNPDGSGELSVEMGFSPDDRELLDNFNLTVEQVCTQNTGGNLSLPPDAAQNLEQRGEEIWCVNSVPFSDLVQLQGYFANVDGITVNQIEIADGQFVYDVEIDLTRNRNPLDLDLPETELIWALTVPGSLGGTNADQIEDNTLTWFVEPGEFINLRAESSVSGPPPIGPDFGGLGVVELIIIGVGLACLCLLGLIAGGAALWLAVRRR